MLNIKALKHYYLVSYKNETVGENIEIGSHNMYR